MDDAEDSPRTETDEDATRKRKADAAALASSGASTKRVVGEEDSGVETAMGGFAGGALAALMENAGGLAPALAATAPDTTPPRAAENGIADTARHPTGSSASAAAGWLGKVKQLPGNLLTGKTEPTVDLVPGLVNAEKATPAATASAMDSAASVMDSGNPSLTPSMGKLLLEERTALRDKNRILQQQNATLVTKMVKVEKGLKEEVARGAAAIEAFEAKIASQAQMVAELRKAGETTGEQLQIVQQECEAFKAQIDEKERQAAESTGAQADAASQVMQMQEEAKDKEERLRNVVSERNELLGWKKRAILLENLLDDAKLDGEDALKSEENARRKLRELEAEMARVRQENNTEPLQRRVAALEEELQGKDAAHAAQVRDLESQVTALIAAPPAAEATVVSGDRFGMLIDHTEGQPTAVLRPAAGPREDPTVYVAAGAGFVAVASAGEITIHERKGRGPWTRMHSIRLVFPPTALTAAPGFLCAATGRALFVYATSPFHPSKTPFCTLPAPADPPTCVASSADSLFLAAGYRSGAVQVWIVDLSATPGQPWHSMDKFTATDKGEPVAALALAAGGAFLVATGAQAASVVVWGPESTGRWAVLIRLQLPAVGLSVAISPNVDFVCIGMKNGACEVLVLKGSQEHWERLAVLQSEGSAGPVHSVVVAQDYVVTGGAGGLKWWKTNLALHSWTRFATYAQRRHVRSLALSLDGTSLVAALDDGEVCVLDQV